MAGVKRVSDRARIRNQVPPNPGVRWFQLENNQEDGAATWESASAKMVKGKAGHKMVGTV